MKTTSLLFASLMVTLACSGESDVRGPSGTGGGGAGGVDASADASVDASADASADAVTEADAAPTAVDCAALTLTTVASGLEQPIFATSAADDPDRLYVIEEVGRVRVIEKDTLLPTAFLDVKGIVLQGQERGLLGLAMHPDYKTNGRFWILYVETAGDIVIVEYARSTADSNLADSTPTKELARFTPSPGNHYAGQLAFGPDGMLYAGIGDGSGAQLLNSKHGKMLRFDVDNHPTPPTGNMTGANVDPAIWSYGFHNPWRFSFDRATGEMYIADVGLFPPREEVNIEPPGEGGRNYGYNVVSGTDCVKPGCDTTGITMPVKVYDHAAGDCAIMGGYVYRGGKVSCLTGKYVYVDLCSRRMWTLHVSDGAIGHEQELTAGALPIASVPQSPVSFGEDAGGELYLITLGGDVMRLEKP